MKKSNVISSVNGISVMIYDGMQLLCRSNSFESAIDAKHSAERIIKYQKELLETTTAYAVVFDSKKMLYYID